MTDPKKDPIDGPVSEQASTKAREIASKLLIDIADNPEWEKIMGLIAGNLIGHAIVKIGKHRGNDAAQKWLELTQSVVSQHVRGDTPDAQVKIKETPK